MKHSIKSKQRIDIHNSIVTVQLLPGSDIEKNAIKNLQNLAGSDAEKELVENYLHFSLELGDYSVVELINQTDTLFVLQIFV